VIRSVNDSEDYPGEHVKAIFCSTTYCSYSKQLTYTLSHLFFSVCTLPLSGDTPTSGNLIQTRAFGGSFIIERAARLTNQIRDYEEYNDVLI